MDLEATEIRYRNEGASSDLVLGVRMDAEIDRDYVKAHIGANIAKPVDWLIEQPVTDRIGIVCGAAPSLNDCLGDIAEKQRQGAVIYACNSAAQVLARNGITPDYQVVLDSGAITLTEHEPTARCHLLASVAQPELFDISINPVLWHPASQLVVDRVEGIERDFTYIGGGISVAVSAVCIAYTLGHRQIDVYGMDSSSNDSGFYANGNSLEDIASQQLRVTVEHKGRSFRTTWDMKQQVVVFLNLAQALKQQGVQVRVYGNGLLPHAFNSSTGEINASCAS